jgi:tetratricopeptide (TPR) repeat protein
MCSKKSLCFLLLGFCLCFTSANICGQVVDPAMSYVRKGNMLYARGDFDGAVANFNKAIELKPTLAMAYLYRGYSRRMQGALDKAIEDYDRATELDPHTTLNNRQVAEAYINHGFIKKGKLEADAAINAYNKAIKLAPGEMQAYLGRGEARLLVEDFPGALADFNYLLGRKDYDPFRTAQAYAGRSFIKLLLGQEDEAKKDLAESYKLVGKEKLDIDQYLKYLEIQLLMMRRLHPQKKPEKVAANAAIIRRA